MTDKTKYTNATKWKELGIKTKLTLLSGILAFFLGWTLTFCSFYVSTDGEVANSVLWVLGQSLVYTASVFGIAQYFNSEETKLRQDISKYLSEHLDNNNKQ